MNILPNQIENILKAKEGEHYEFKEAKNQYSFEELIKYCVALANEGGGKMVLGVNDKRPRRVVGTKAFSQPERTCRGLIAHLRLRIDFRIIDHPDGRVLIFEVPSRPVGVPIQYKGIYWSREGDSLIPMSQDKLREIFAESGHDFSADICPEACFDDLDPNAIEDFRKRWIKKSGNNALSGLTREQLLEDAEAVKDNKIKYAALILFGKKASLGRFLALAELIFEYRPTEISGPASVRKEFRQGFFSYYDELWNLINERNDVQHYQEGFFIFDIPTFSERPIRESILNAVCHRDYQLGGSVFIRQYPRKLIIESPGGLPVGITVDNILDRQSPRNRCIAEIFARCGLVERSGQGMNLIFEQSIQQGKALPDFTGTDQYQLVLTLNCQVQDPLFVQFLEKVAREKNAAFTTDDFLILDVIHREHQIPDKYKSRLKYLDDMGVIETVGRGRGVRRILSRRFYSMAGKKGTYTRKRGLDHETNKKLIEKHIHDQARAGATLEELQEVLPALSRGSLKWLLQSLKSEGRIHVVGKTRGARWFPVQG